MSEFIEAAMIHKLPDPMEVGFAIAKLRLVRTALDETGLKLPDIEVAQEAKSIAEEVAPNQRLDSHPVYPFIVLNSLNEMLPTTTYLARPDTDVNIRRQNGRLASLIEGRQVIRPRRTLGKKHRTQLGKTDAVQTAALSDGLIKARIVEQTGDRRYGWPLGIIAAAAFYQADQMSEASNQVYRNWRAVRAVVESCSRRAGIRKLPTGRGHRSVYNLLNDITHAERERLFGDIPGNQHDLFWHELTNDLLRLEAFQPED